MAMSNAERQRKFRENRNVDAEKRQKYLQQSKERYKKDRAKGKNKSVQNMTEREKRHTRKIWRRQKRKDRERVKRLQSAVNNEPTPPTSPELVQNRSSQKKRQKKLEKRHKAKCYRENDMLKTEIENMKRKLKRYQKRFQRAEKHKRSVDSPRTKTRKLLRHMSHKETKRCIFVHNVVMEQLRQKYREKKKGDKRSFTKILSGHVLKKYKLKTETYRHLGIHAKQSEIKNKEGYISLSKRICERIKSFYTRNDNSRLIAGKKQTKTRKKVKKQRRVLLHSLKVLYQKFLSEGKTKLSYSAFCRLRPFYAVFPRQSDRNTCMCKTCDNTELMAAALLKVKAIQNNDIEMLMIQKVCDTNKQKCMYRDCEVCKLRKLEVNKDMLDETVTWEEWKTKTEKREMKQCGKNIEKVVTLTVKEEVEGKVDSLLDKFDEQLNRYMAHIYRCKVPYKYFKDKTQNMSDEECILNIDFSENYVCKYAREIHSVHFGASKKQLTLHTGVLYIKNKTPVTFCSVSESLHHGPAAVWCHIMPILKDIRSDNPNISKIEIFSDGPATQYRQKANFHLTSVKPTELGFQDVKWSFFESGHGKGVPDAVGGSVKKFAYNKVKYGTDINSADDFCKTLSGSTKTVMYCIPEAVVFKEQEQLCNVKLKAVPGTLRIHQVVVLNAGKIAHRNLSCDCHIGAEHKGHEFKKAEVSETPIIAQDKIGKCESSQTVNTRLKGQPTKAQENKLGPKKKGKRKQANQMGPECKKQKKKQQTSKSTDFSKLLKTLKECKNFTELRSQCEKIDVQGLIAKPEEISLLSNKLDVDYDAFLDVPDDIPDDRRLYPCVVVADGNCLPSCGSVYAYGNVTQTHEMRFRIIKELALNEDIYLNDEFLCQGSGADCSKLCVTYSQFSDYYVPGVSLTSEQVQDIYRHEVMSITENRSYMGIWQMFALASVLSNPIYSVYPQKGNINVRRELNRLILPRMAKTKDKQHVYVLWTNTREDVTNEHWVPNHFVPLVPFDTSNTRKVAKSKPDCEQSNNSPAEKQENETINQNEVKQSILNDTKEGKTHGDTCDKKGEVDSNNNLVSSEHIQSNSSTKPTVKHENNTIKENETINQNEVKQSILNEDTEEGNTHSDTCDKKGEVDSNNNLVSSGHIQSNSSTKPTVKHENNTIKENDNQPISCDNIENKTVDSEQIQTEFDSDTTDISSYIGKYVLVKYKGRPYPGIVTDTEGTDIEIECLNPLGKRAQNKFFWPKKLKDISWYDYEDVMCIIPEPRLIENSLHLCIDDKLWATALETLKTN